MFEVLRVYMNLASVLSSCSVLHALITSADVMKLASDGGFSCVRSASQVLEEFIGVSDGNVVGCFCSTVQIEGNFKNDSVTNIRCKKRRFNLLLSERCRQNFTIYHLSFSLCVLHDLNLTSFSFILFSSYFFFSFVSLLFLP